MKSVYDVIIAPVISEKSMDGIENRKYTFKVAADATKADIAAAVEKVFGVKVAKVNTINCKSKPKRLGVHAGYTSEWKKAVVTLAEGSIEFFDGMR